MNKSIFVFLIICLIACNSSNKKEEQDLSKSGEEWTSMFNGQDLDGWIIKINKHEINDNFGNTFRVQDSILSVRYGAYGDDFDDQFGAIFFEKSMSEYRLKLEYRFVGETAPGAPEWGFRDSGVQFHSQAPVSMKINQPFPVCLEYNLHGGNGTDERPTGEICASGTTVQIDGKANELFCTPPIIQRTFHGDQWVMLELDVKDGVIRHFVNGEEILTYSNPEYDAEHELGKTFIQDGNSELNGGYIALQSNSHPIDFRRIMVKEYDQ